MTITPKRVSALDVPAAPDDELRALYDLVAAEHHELWEEDPWRLSTCGAWIWSVTSPSPW